MAQPRQAQPRHSKQAWEDRRALIKQLYIDEDMPLPELIRTMAQLHSFPATGRMYKRKFENWGLRKYNTKDTARQIVNEKVRRQAAGKRSCFTRNGKVINLESYLKRKGITEYHVMDLDDPANTVTLPDGIRCCTPDPQLALEPPALLHFHESFLRSVENLCRMAETMNHNDLRRSPDCSSIIANMGIASSLTAEGEVILGGHLMRAAFASIDRYIAEADALSALHLIFCLDDEVEPGSTLIFWKYLNARLEGSQHAWRNMVKPVYGWLHDLGWASFTTGQDQARRMLVERHPATSQLILNIYIMDPFDSETTKSSIPSMSGVELDYLMMRRLYTLLLDIVQSADDILMAAGLTEYQLVLRNFGQLCQNSPNPNEESIADRISSDVQMYLSFAELLCKRGDLQLSAQRYLTHMLKAWLMIKYLLPAFEAMRVYDTKYRMDDEHLGVVADHLEELDDQFNRLKVGISAKGTG